MVFIHGKSKKKATGGRYTSSFTKRRHMKGSRPAHTHIGEEHKKTTPTKGGGHKTKLFSANKVNVYNPKTKKHSIAEIKTALENSADMHFVRHNTITRGAVLDTSLGKVKITSRPGQEGAINGVLVE